MGRASARYVPLDMAILSLAEFALSFIVIHLMLDDPSPTRPLGLIGSPDIAAVGLMFQGNEKVAALALTIGGVILAAGFRFRRSDVFLDRKRMLAAAGIAGLTSLQIRLLVVSGFVQVRAALEILLLTQIFSVWLATVAVFYLFCSFTIQPAAAMRRILIFGDPARVDAIHARLNSRRGRRFKPLMAGPTTPSWDLLRHQDLWGVVVAPGSEASVSEHLLDCKLRGIKVISDAAFQESHLGRIDPATLTVDHLLLADGFAAGRLSDVAKRACDIGVSIALLFLTLPMMALTAAAIKLDSPGPAFYRQRRIGRFGRPFTLLKFRSMAVDAEDRDKPRWAQKQDPRVTRVGAFIRATRMDELPQLVNIICGEMSLVGPRPERPHFVEQLTQAIPFYQHRAYIKPGLTGWAQVNFRYGASVEDAREKLAYDLYYVKHRSVMLDLAILVSTIRVVLLREGAR